ncbi:MAG: hypothetical protein ACTHKN_21675, partial [Achromobacter mucicolens]
MKRLDLQGGHDAGPLFNQTMVRAPKLHTGRMHGLVRRRHERIATPPWADRDAIAAVYREAQRMTQQTGALHVVDHIVPLRGRIVSGLHVHWNMRVVHWRENAT